MHCNVSSTTTYLSISFNFSEGATLDRIMESMMTTGFQATNVGLAIDEINRMVSVK
jgi:deoxyhypusine synthase